MWTSTGRQLRRPKSQHLGDFLFGLLTRIRSTLRNVLVVDAKHCAGCGVEIHVEEALQDANDELHGREIIIHEKNAMQRLFLRHGVLPNGRKSPIRPLR
jgi:hypothetical protein